MFEEKFEGLGSGLEKCYLLIFLVKMVLLKTAWFITGPQKSSSCSCFGFLFWWVFGWVFLLVLGGFFMRNKRNSQQVCFFSNSPTCLVHRFWTWLCYGKSQCPGVLGGPVWRLPQHGAVYNRPVHQLRPGQVGSSQRDRPALATWNGRNGESCWLACAAGKCCLLCLPLWPKVSWGSNSDTKLGGGRHCLACWTASVLQKRMWIDWLVRTKKTREIFLSS